MKPASWRFSLLIACSAASAGLAAPGAEFATTDEGIVGTYRKIPPDVDLDTSKARDQKNKPRVTQRQRELLEQRYDLADRPSGQLMGGGRRAVQSGSASRRA